MKLANSVWINKDLDVKSEYFDKVYGSFYFENQEDPVFF